MRILFISNHFPEDLRTYVGGTYRRLDMLIEALRGIAQLDVLFYVPSDTDVSPVAIAQKQEELSAHWQMPISLFLCPRSAALKDSPKWKRQSRSIFNYLAHECFTGTTHLQQLSAFEACLHRQPDAIFVHRLRSMAPLMLSRQPMPPIIFDLDDIEHLSFMRGIQQPPARLQTNIYYSQVPALWWGECRAIRMAKRTFVCSDIDRRYLVERWGLPGIVTIPNGIISREPQPLTSEPTLLFLGSYDYLPNINAANFLVEKVWPRIYQQMPNARLTIAGRESQNIRSYTKRVPGVEFAGFVEDLDALYRRSKIICCPVFSGGGTRTKLIEAAAYGKPIVASRIGAEGLALVPGEDYLQCDHPDEFATACIRLFQDNILSQNLTSSAHTKVIKYYDESNIIKLIQKQIQP